MGDVENPEEHPLNKMSLAVLRVAHEAKANVGIPGTQSGIGTFFGREAVHYRNQFGHLPKAEQAHVFAVSPGGNVHYPGSPYSNQAAQEERFAITPVDSIITPFPADWGLKGKDKLSSRYLDHIAYMESLYERMSQDRERVMVVGNGGLYSIMEINESLKRGFELFLVKDSGRFAEVASAIFEQMDKFDENAPEKVINAAILDIARTSLGADVFEEWVKKDFGREVRAQTDDAEVYRMYFHSFLKAARGRKNQVHVTTIETLERDLGNVVLSAA